MLTRPAPALAASSSPPEKDFQEVASMATWLFSMTDFEALLMSQDFY
jgi:hypothetical protein